MTHCFRCNLEESLHRALGAAGRIALAAWINWALSAAAAAQQPHFQHPTGLPPGAVGYQQLQRGGPLSGFFQPVEIKVPPGAAISLAEAGALGPPQKSSALVGLLVGQVYRINVSNIPLHEGQDVYPTIEIIDRLYAPVGQEQRFPIEIDLTQDDLELALGGKFVTRVVYLEDPQRAIPGPEDGPQQAWFDIGPGRDPLVVADELGRPVAIVRIGGRVPDQAPDAEFLFGSPPLVKYPPRPALPSAPPRKPAAPAGPRTATARTEAVGR